MLDYVFFDRQTCEAFVGFLSATGVQFEQSDEDGIFQVSIPEDTVEAGGAIERRYDELMEAASGHDDDEDSVNLGGLTVTLSDGSVSYAVLPANLVSKLTEALSNDELQQLVSAIANAAENPDSRSLCQRVREGDIT
ncbi:hypothetical protein Q4485_05350 [Granulosicoccaceae sp. 1_MG-2023]|nr:hypothetical protein [Granulosicoccaceae sp. 1_MG-2023]